MLDWLRRRAVRGNRAARSRGRRIAPIRRSRRVDDVRGAVLVARLHPYAVAPVGAVAAIVAAVLLAVVGRYGYHRDELYFLAAGHHLAWGYPDQPPLVPLIARGMSALAPDSVVVLRLPSVGAAVAVIVMAAAIARELGAGRSGQTVAATCMALSPVFLGAFHLLSTTTFDLVAWAIVLWLVVRILRTGDDRLWPAVGLAAGVGLMDSDLMAFLGAGVAVGVASAGPRRVLRCRWLWVGVLIAVALWAPYLIWQASHGWPQLAESRAIAAGESGSSAPRALLLPYQVLLAGPWVAPVWIAGLVRLLRGPALRPFRALGIAWLFVAAIFLLTGGKPYYLSGFLPLLFAAGAQPVVAWLTGHRRPFAVVAVAIVLTLPSVGVALPVVPVGEVARLRLASVDYDLGEQIGWPGYVGQIRAAYGKTAARQRSSIQIITANYGEAGAIDHYRRNGDLPAVFSGQTGYWYWARPTASTVLAVGFPRAVVNRYFSHVDLVTTLHNRFGVRNDEQGAPVWRCSGLRRPWSAIWPQFKHT